MNNWEIVGLADDFLDGKQYDKNAMGRCTEIMVKLQEFEPSWVMPGALKAAFLFELEN